MTSVQPCTVDPLWDSEHIFPLEVDSIDALLDAKCVVLVRDEDINDGVVAYDDLGKCYC